MRPGIRPGIFLTLQPESIIIPYLEVSYCHSRVTWGCSLSSKLGASANGDCGAETQEVLMINQAWGVFSH